MYHNVNMWFSFIPLIAFQGLSRWNIHNPFSKHLLPDVFPKKIIFIPHELPELDYQDLLLFLS